MYCVYRVPLWQDAKKLTRRQSQRHMIMIALTLGLWAPVWLIHRIWVSEEAHEVWVTRRVYVYNVSDVAPYTES